MKMSIKKNPKTTKEHREKWANNIEYFIQKFFSTITACPVKITRDPLHIKIKFIHSIRYISFVVILSIFIYLLTIIIVRIFCINPSSNLNIWNESSNLCLVLSTCLAIFIETQFTYGKFLQFLSLQQKTERDLSMLCTREMFDGEKYLFIKQYWKLLISFQIFEWILDLWHLFRIWNDPLWLFHCISMMLPTMFTRLRCLQHRFYTSTIYFYVKLIRIQIQQHEYEIESKESLAKLQGQKEFVLNSVKLYHDLCLSKRIFTSIFQMTHLVNKMFGFSLLMNVIENFVQLLSNLFWIYTKLHRQQLEHLPEIFLRIVPTTIIIIILLSSCERCHKEVVNIVTCVHVVRKSKQNCFFFILICFLLIR